MEKEIQLILVPYQADKLEAGMYWVSEAGKEGLKVYQLSENDLLNSAVQEELLDRTGQFGKNFGLRKPYLVSNEINVGDSFCFTWKGEEQVSDLPVSEINEDDGDVITKPKGQRLKAWLKDYCKKIVATPEQIGLKQCWSANINEDNGWEEGIDADDINHILSKGGKCKIVIDHKGNPELKHGQVIFDFTI
jgi:hypothetical protein